ncbi:hypothetical protein [Conexibacter sp. CPCC 206217]|uniref:hypothetical protein n=1 Tax=Conexibacter sp. CPCC 206217 TaxID=3064574 RepID=UPI002717A3D1|nr:hypothetical protein [Conexibacter sp. CPCC 206217]MDO8210260.1 hypothetical protein [Conexibacter sp. CPCC 206217]
MTDGKMVLGLGPQYATPRLAAAFAVIGPNEDDVTVLEPWQGAREASLGQQLFAFFERLETSIDQHRPNAIALRRPESNRGATTAHDAKVALVGVGLLVAQRHRLASADLRSNQLNPSHDSTEVQRLLQARSAGDLAGAIAAGLTLYRR